MEFRFCHNCGTQVAANAKFCAACGTALKRPPVQEIVPPSAPDPEPVSAPVPEAVPAAPAPTVFTLDNLDAPAPQPEPVKRSVVFTLDSLPVDVPAQPEPKAEPAPVPEPTPVCEPEVPVIPAAPPSPPEVVTPPAKPRPKKGILARRGAARTIFSILLCILIFFWSFISLTGFNVRMSLEGSNGAATLEQILKGIDLTKIQADFLVSGLEDKDASLALWMVDTVLSKYDPTVSVDEEDLQEFLEYSSVNAFLAQQLSDYIRDIAAGKADAMVTVSELQYQLTRDSDLIYDIFGVDLTEEQIDAIAESAAQSGALDLLSTEVLREDNADLFRIGQIALSWWIIGGLGLILLILLLLLAAAEGSILRTCSDTGITLMVSSGLWGAAGLFALALPKLWNSMLYPIRPIGQIVGAVLKAGLIPTAVVFGTGAVLVLIRVFGKLIAVHNAAKR